MKSLYPNAAIVIGTAFIFGSGCGEPTRVTDSAATSQRSKESGERSEIVFIFSPDENEERTRLAKQAFFDFVAQADPQSWVHLAIGKEQSHLASFEVPEGSANRRFRELRQVIPRIHAAFDEPDTEDQGQVNLPALAATVRQLRRTTQPCRVAIYGSPLYLDPNQQAFSHTPGKVTTDASIGHPHSPFQTTTKLPEGTLLVWVSPAADFGLDERQREAVRRFNGLYVQCLGGALIRTTEDTSLLYNFDTPFTIEQIVAVDSNPGNTEVSVRTVAVEGSEGIGTVVFRTTEIDIPNGTYTKGVEAVLTAAESAPGTMAIAINWTSADPSCDIDMYLTSNGLPGELYYGNQETKWGKHFKDVVASSTDTEVNVEDFKNWEWLRVNHARLHDLVLYLNVFRSSAPARVTIVRVWNGKRKVRVIDLNADNGDGGVGKSNRRGSDAWRRVSLYSFSKNDEPGTL